MWRQVALVLTFLIPGHHSPNTLHLLEADWIDQSLSEVSEIPGIYQIAYILSVHN